MQLAGTYQLATKKEYSSYLKKLVDSPNTSTLSQAALETLAIVAYKQPITRMEIEDIRGVKTERPLQTLVAKALIKEVGRVEGAGRAILYGTTKEFLDYFGLRNINELPPLPEKVDEEYVQEEADLFFERFKEIGLLNALVSFLIDNMLKCRKIMHFLIFLYFNKTFQSVCHKLLGRGGVSLIIKKSYGYELEKTKSNTFEDYFNRSEVLIEENGKEHLFKVLYLRYFEENLHEFTPYQSNPIFQLDGKDIELKDMVALACLIKYPSYRTRQQVYISNKTDFARCLEGLDFDEISTILKELEAKPIR